MPAQTPRNQRAHNFCLMTFGKAIVATGLLLGLAACGGGGGSAATTPSVAAYTVGGTVSGLTGSVVLQDNLGDNLTVSADGTYTFAAQVSSGSAYSVTVLTQPTGQTCTVTGGTGTISGNVTNIAVTCTNNSYTVSGSVSGLTGSVVLQDNGGDNLTVAANGAFTFATPVSNGNTYNVTVLTQPSGQTCSVSTGAGTISGGNVTNVVVVCATPYSVGGTISGLTGTVVLQDNNSDNLTVSANGAFTFATKVANGSPYSVTVLTQPTGQSCSVASGTGTIAAANVTNVAISCATNTYTIGGTISGANFNGGGSMTLQNNGADDLKIGVNGPFTFATSVAYGNPYNVTVLFQPSGQTCTVTSGSGTTKGNVTNVAANCILTPGTLDAAFATGGKFSWDGGSTKDGGYDVAADPAGGYYVVGATGPSAAGAIWRLTSNGALDTTFNTTGVLKPAGAGRIYRGLVSNNLLYAASSNSTTSNPIFCITNTGANCPGFNGGSSLAAPTYPLAIANDPSNGDILIAGGNGATGWITSVSRASSAGILGTTYTSTGPLGTAGSNMANGIIVDASGKAYISGYALSGTALHTYLLRLTQAMALDTTFNSGGAIPGVVDLGIGGGNGGLVAFDSTGKLLVTDGGGNLMRVTTTGALDTTFATAGTLTVNPTIDKIAVDGNGKIILIGRSGISVEACRYSSTGTIDTSFNGTGCQTFASFTGPWGGVEESGGTVDSSNRVLVTYPFNTGGTGLADVAAHRLNP